MSDGTRRAGLPSSTKDKKLVGSPGSRGGRSKAGRRQVQAQRASAICAPQFSTASSRTFLFPGGSPDGTTTEGQWNRWTQGTFRAAKLAVGLPTARAYDLRHSFVSLHEGLSILEVARQAGHLP